MGRKATKKMIISGTNEIKINSREIYGPICHNCGSNKISIKCLGKHLHLFYIPVFPTSKRAIPQCDNCRTILKKENLKEIEIKKIENKDIIVFKENNNKSYFGKVHLVKNDSVFFRVSNYYLTKNKPSQYDYYNQVKMYRDFYSKDTIVITQKEIDSLFSNNQIINLYR